MNPKNPLSKERALALTLVIKQSASQLREALYEMYEGRGWEVMGYGSWRDYLTSELASISYPYLTRQTKAALLEAKAGFPIGSHKEAHLRPILEILPDEADRLVAYAELSESDPPTATAARAIAARIYSLKYGSSIIRDRVRDGSLAPLTALEIIKQEPDNPVMELVSDPELIPILKRLEGASSSTWEEIRNSFTIPAFPNPIPIEKATAANLLAWLDVASAEHRAAAIEERRHYFNGLSEAIGKLVDECYRLASGEPFDLEKMRLLINDYEQAKERRE